MTNKPMLSVERDERADFEKEVQAKAKAERFQPDFRRYSLHSDADYKCANNQWAWELWQKRASMDKPAAQHQGDPVGYVPDFQAENFLAKRGRSFSVCPAEWSNIEKDMPLYAEQPAPVAPFKPDTVVCRRYTLEQSPGQNFYHYDLAPVYGSVPVTLSDLIFMAEGKPVAVVMPLVMPETRAQGHDMGGNYDEGYADGWNMCLAEVARLNGVNK